MRPIDETKTNFYDGVGDQIETNEFLDSEDDVQVTSTEKVKEFLSTHKSTIIKVSLSVAMLIGGAMLLNSRKNSLKLDTKDSPVPEIKPEKVFLGKNVKIHDWDELDNGDRMFMFEADSINDFENFRDVFREDLNVDYSTSLYGYIFTDEKEM